MKRNKFFPVLAGLMMLAAGATVSSCSTGDGEDELKELSASEAYSSVGGDGDKSDGAGADMSISGDSNGGNSQNGNTQAGVVTAGEWNDLDHWDFWSKLMTGDDYADKSSYWECYTNHRVAVQVTDEAGTTLAGIPVKLVRMADDSQTTVWEAVTDCHGRADCWLSIWQKSESADASTLRIDVGGQLMDKQPVVCGWDSLGQLTTNKYVCDNASVAVQQQADIAFVVDATGSMMDEIDFLKSDLVDIISKVSELRPGMKIRTSALFYRDEGDEYLTRYTDFTADVNNTADFVNEQQADGGNDYPEAVHTALEQTLIKMSWDAAARTRIVFLILDAPAHHETNVIRSLQASVQECARRGIRLIPVAASGVDKNTEFMLRFFAVATGGTYVFLTNDSGVGLRHIRATVGDYEVEQLNNLIIRLIKYYTE